MLKKLLQGQLTCNIGLLQPGVARFAAHCNPQGRIISLFWLWVLDDDYFLFLPLESLALMTRALKKYAIFYKITIEEVSHLYQIKGGQGNIDPNCLSVALTPARHLLITTDTSAANSLAEIKSAQAWQYGYIQEGFPTIYPATSEKLLPHEINLHLLNAIDFDKGCYTGQEIIARMHYKGKVKKHLYSVTLDSSFILSPGQEIMLLVGGSRRSVGMIIDHCNLEAKQHALIMMEDNYIFSSGFYLEDRPLQFLSPFHSFH